jgi:hypothetical protein
VENGAYVPLLVFMGMNDRNFADRERTLGEIISLFFGTLYLCTSMYVSLLSISYSGFLVHFALFS